MLGTGRVRTGGCLVAHALHTQRVTPGSSAKDSLRKCEQATSFSFAPGPPLCWQHRGVTVINMYQVKDVI